MFVNRTEDECLKSKIIMIIILVPFFFPTGLNYLLGANNINIIFHVLKIVSIIIFFFTEKKRKINIRSFKTEYLVILVTIYGIAVTISNLLHSHDVLALRFSIYFPAFAIICIYYFKKKARQFCTIICYITGVYNLCQMATVVKYYPNGINNYVGYFWKDTLAGAQYFLGSKNQAVFYMLLFLLSFTLKNYYSERKISIKFYIFSLLFIVESVVLDSANTIFSIMMFVALYTICSTNLYNQLKFLYKPKIYILFSVLFFLLVCLRSDGGSIGVVSAVLKLLGRDPTFTNRTYIWAIATKNFITSPLIGVGEIELHVLTAKQVHAHNMYLDILYKYGMLGFIPYFFMIIESGKKINRRNGNYIASLASSFLFVMMLHNCFDAMDNYIFILVTSMFCTIYENYNYEITRCFSGAFD